MTIFVSATDHHPYPLERPPPKTNLMNLIRKISLQFSKPQVIDALLITSVVVMAVIYKMNRMA